MYCLKSLASVKIRMGRLMKESFLQNSAPLNAQERNEPKAEMLDNNFF